MTNIIYFKNYEKILRKPERTATDLLYVRKKIHKKEKKRNYFYVLCHACPCQVKIVSIGPPLSVPRLLCSIHVCEYHVWPIFFH